MSITARKVFVFVQYIARRLHLYPFSLLLGMSVILFPVAARADVVADANAPASQRPTVLEAGNGVPLVNIRTPSAAGVSRNTYSEFNVDQQGVILNNGRTDSSTQLGGWVQANPWLATGSARVILNEVNSSDPSRLNGYVEVAGSRAQVVIANPAGISCDGCGFINANRTTLSTGTPIVNNGQLQGYDVNGGQVQIGGAGLDNSTGYTDLIGQAVEVNAGIWTQRLNVAGGGGTVNADVNAVSGNGSNAPAVAIDVSQLGGMYAGSIHLIGTQAGVGVRNAGQIGIGAGEVTLTADGRIENSGVINGGNTRLDADTLDNTASGRIYGDRVSVGADTVDNIGDGSSAPVIAARQQLDIGAATINNREHGLLFSGGDMAIGGALDESGNASGQADALNNASASIEALGDLDLSVRQINNTDEHLQVTDVLIDSERVREYRGDGSQSRYSPNAVGFVRHDQSRDLRTPDGTYRVWYEYNYTRTVHETQVVEADPARIVAGGDLHLTSDRLHNDNSHVLAGGTLNGDVANIVNTSAEFRTTEASNGQVTRYRRVEEDDAAGTKSHWEQRSSTSGYHPVEIVLHPERSLAIAQSGAAVTGSTLPDSSLYTANPAAPNGYLIETDPQFANYRQWISSDYMLQQLAVDPALTQMRLGDGFYEQQLVREQMATLTGRRFMSGYADDETQYIALMDAGVTFAQEHNIRPGIALTAEQMAQLTSDIVWLVEEQRTLPDGATANVLVPRLYVMVRDGGINGSGGLIAADTIRLDMSGDVDNSGTLAGHRITALTADNINNVRGTLHGADVQLNARNDINTIGGSIRALDNLDIQAGNDINIVSTTRTASNEQGTRTHIDRVAGLYVNSGSLLANAGNNINLTGAAIVNDSLVLDADRLGHTVLTAGNDFILNSVQESEMQRIVWDAHNQLYDANSRAVGSVVSTRGDLSISAGRDVAMTAAQVNSAQGALQIAAARDIAIGVGQNSSELLSTHRYKSQSGTFSNATTTSRIHLTSSTAVASTLSAENISVVAGQDLSVTGSNVVSDSGILLAAGNNVTIAAATDTLTESHYSKTKKSGVSTSGASISVGTQSQKMNSDTTRQLASASTIASLAGDVTIAAGQHYQQTGSAVLAPTGDILIAAQSVDIVEARHEMRSTTQTETKQSGLTLSLSTPVVDAITTTDRMYSASKQTDDKRMQALAATSAALAGYNAFNSPTAFKVSASLGSSKSKSVSDASNSAVAGSTVSAGNNVIISAQGAQSASDITVRGSQISGGNQVHLLAEDEVKLLAAANHNEYASKNKSSSGAIGASMGNQGPTVDVSGSKGKGHGNGSDTTWSNTRIDAGNLLVIDSGGDTTLRGAVATAEHVNTRIGGDLLIESLQDQSRYDSKQKNTGGSLSVGVSSISGTVDLSRSRIRSDYVSVQEQSGIFAGDGGFDVDVQGHTTLIGGAIASTQVAVDGERNQFQSHNGLTLQDIDNRAEYDARGYAVSLGVGSGPQNHPGTPSGSAGYADDSDSARSVTRAGISGIAGNSDLRTGDESGGIAPIFDANRVQRELDAHIAITQEFGKQAPQAWAHYAVEQQREALARDDLETAQKWAEGGEYRIAGHVALGAFGGDLAGATGALISAGIMPQLESLLQDPSLPTPVQQALGMVTSATLGAIAGAQGAATAFNVDTNNRQLHPDEIKWLLENADAFAEKQGITREEALQRLAQQALREVDYLWRSQLSDGDDEAAQQFLQSDTTFTNDIGNAQKLFTAEGQQLLRPDMYLDVADLSFYRQYAQVGISRPLGEGLRKELQDSGVALKDDAIDLVQLTVDNPKLVLDALWEAVRNTPQAIVDGVHETGVALGEGSATLFNDDIKNKLNALYGQDVSAHQQTLLALRTLATIVGTVTAGKAGGEVLDQTTDALGKATEAAARKLDEISGRVAERTLLRNAGVLDSDGHSMLDMKQLTNEQKAVMGDLFGGETVRRIVPDGEKIARTPGVGETGIDDIYRVNRSDVDYVIIEYKFVGDYSTNGSSRLGNTADGRQGSESWIGGSSRIENAVGGLNDEALNIRNALDSGRIESWVVTTRPDGSTSVQVLDGMGRPKSIDTSNIIVPTHSLSGARP